MGKMDIGQVQHFQLLIPGNATQIQFLTNCTQVAQCMYAKVLRAAHGNPFGHPGVYHLSRYEMI